MAEKHSVIILGAGVAGISAAEKLTSNGFEVIGFQPIKFMLIWGVWILINLI